jgi:hypothetical protein
LTQVVLERRDWIHRPLHKRADDTILAADPPVPGPAMMPWLLPCGHRRCGLFDDGGYGGWLRQ